MCCQAFFDSLHTFVCHGCRASAIWAGMNKQTPHPHHNTHRWMVFSVICMVYFLVYFHRVSTSVIVSELLEAFHTNATALGFMSSMYFYIYAFEQPLVGYLSDRIGPRRVIAYWSLAAAAGCFLFGMAPNIGWASVGRALIGFGVGGVYVPAIKAISLWFEEKEFSTMVGLLMSMGNVGAVIATTPLAWATVYWGWRATFFLIGGITFGLAFVTLMFTRDYPHPPESVQEDPDAATGSNPGTGAKALQVLSSVQFWIVSIVFFGIYGTLITLQGLWATPFLMTALGIEHILASKLNMLIPVGVIIGAPSFGWLPNRFSLNKGNTLIAILAVYTLTWVGIIFFFRPLGIVGLTLMLLVMGVVAGGFISVLWGIVRETTPVEIMGLTSGMLNPAPFFGVAVLQVLTGAILDRAGRIGDLYPLSGYTNAFLACLFVIVICLLLSFYFRRPSHSAAP
jgi:sugar phosphate permease